MQNTSRAQGRPRRSVLWMLALLVACFVVFFVFRAGLTPAHAKSYDMPSVNIEATLANDGSLHVVEQRTFDFSGSFTCVWWEFDQMYHPKKLVPNGVSIAYESPDDPESFGSPVALDEVPFDTLWRVDGGPGNTSYSVDASYDAIYVFFDVTDESIVVTLDYTVVNAADVYNDCAELNWQFLGSDWAEDSQNVSCVIHLPAQGATATPGEDVRAWGHGPLSGTVNFDDVGTTVSYDINRVKSGEFAEAHIVFPKDWMAVGSDYEGLHFYSNLDDILEYEQVEAEKANRGRIVSMVAFGILGAISLASVIWAIVMYFIYGREYRPNFRDKYWRDVPNKNAHPATIARLIRWNKPNASDVLTTILHLANIGAVSINKGMRAPQGISAAPLEESYYLTLKPGVAENLVNPIDKELVKFIFGDISHNGTDVWIDEIKEWGEDHKKSFNSKLKKWQSVVDRQVKSLGFFEGSGESKQDSAHTLVWGLAVLGIMLAYLFENFWPLVFFGIASVIVLIIAHFMPRRSREGAEDFARARGLKRWLKDFTLLDERIPTDVKVWGDFMVYAQVFGVAGEVIKQLRGKVPELFAEGSAYAGGSDGLPWYVWYSSGSTRTSAGEPFSSVFDRTWTNTSNMAAAAAAAASSGGSGGGFSSGGGFGGGFSGGGGGGFGGGGGGAR